MNELICPDCGQETDKLISSTKTCILCYKRWQNAKTKGKPYVKLIDIKGTKEYNRAMGRRNAAKTRKEGTMKNKDNIKSKTNNENLSDVNVIKQKILAIGNYKYIDIQPDDIYNAMQVLKNAIEQKDCIENLASVISEDLLVLSHDKEHTNGPGDPAYASLQEKEFVLLKYRRQLKDIFAYLNLIRIDSFSESLKAIDDTKVRLDKNEYVPKYKVYNLYKVSVNVSGLNGSSKIESFDRQVYAENPDSAKSYVSTFLDKLKSITVYGKTWVVKELEKNVSFKKD